MRWNDERGFGFVVPHGGGGDVFAHVSAFPGSRRPAQGDRVQFTATRDTSGRLRADSVRIDGVMRIDGVTGPQPHTPPPRRRATRSLKRVRWAAGIAALTTLLAVIVARSGAGQAWLIIVAVYVLASLLTFAAYHRDKAAAQRGEWRVPESTLHIFALLGGWPGAFIAQVRLRHKTIKAGFQTGFWLTVLANLAVLALLPQPWIAEAAALVADLAAPE